MFVQAILFPLSPSLCLSPSRPPAPLHHKPANSYDKPPATAGDYSYDRNICMCICISFSIPSMCKSVCLFARVQVQEQEAKTHCTPASPFINRRPQVKTKWEVLFTSSFFLHVLFDFPASVTACNCNNVKVPEGQSQKCLSFVSLCFHLMDTASNCN